MRWLRLRVWATRGKLDREIVGGCAGAPADALALRVSQLTDRSTRREIARELRRVVEYVERHGSAPVLSCVVVESGAVRAGREAILGLAERLEADAQVRAAGVVLARALLTDGVSPLHNPHCRQSVNEAIFAVQDALGGYSASEFDAVAA
jgi:hypothetical protein